MFPLAFLVSFLLFTKGIIGDEVRIKDINDFSTFANNVNSGTNYSGTTVYLDSDLSPHEITEPIGVNETYQFLGTFDGQGHVISNFKLNYSLINTGLFGYSEGLTIRNIVLDDSCSITNSFSGSKTIYIGGIIGCCYSKTGGCIIENSVNMASITFNGNLSSYSSSLGGIIGYFDSSPISTYFYIKNCANYGAITNYGINKHSTIGGIVGVLNTNRYKYIHNCFNYGTLIHNGTTTYTLSIGGIAGDSYYAYIENCVSASKTVLSGTYSSNTTGSITGWASSHVYINYCYYTSDTNISSLYGSGTPLSVEGSPDSPINVDSTLINNLNNHSSYNDWNKWILNTNNNTVTFKVNNNKGFSFYSQIIPLPDLNITSSLVFSGWYTDPYYKKEFKSNEIIERTSLYALYGEIFTVYFNATEGNVVVTSKKVSVNNPYGDLPEPLIREGYTFDGWFTEKNEVVKGDTIVNIGNDHTLYAHWTINNYTITFISDNGTVPEVKTFGYNSTIIYPDDPVKEGYTFNRWNKSDVHFMPAENLTIMALWTVNNYTVTFNLSGGDKIDKESIEVTFNNPYGNLPIPATREGYTFDGWLTEKNEVVISDTRVNISDNHTLYAHWTINNYTITFIFDNGSDLEIKTFEFNATIIYPNDPIKEGYTFDGWNNSFDFMPAENVNITAKWTKITTLVEITFDSKDISDEKIKEIIEHYTDADYSIEMINNIETGETRIIIKFSDTGKAEEFVRNVITSSITEDNSIKRVGFVPENYNSFSTVFCPLSLLLFSF